MRKLHRVRGEEIDPQSKDIHKGQLTIPTSQIEKIDKQLEKIEIKTDKLIKKSIAIANKSLTSNEQVISESLTYHEQKRPIVPRKEASLIEFYSLKGLPKIIANIIKDKANFEPSLSKWISIVDTEEIKTKSKKSPNHIAVQIVRMQEQNWFKVLNSTNSGMRVFEIPDPKIYGIIN